ncbi:MAG: ABC transporter permease [Phycisphaerales bacterium]|nr:MAG: ABC transporter permease [Phycisphaerales bacterium]
MSSVSHLIRQLKQDRIRIALTLFGIVWGTVSITVLSALGESVHRALLKGQKGQGDGLVRVAGGVTSRPYAGYPRGRWIGFIRRDGQLIRDKVPEAELVCAEFGAPFREVAWRGRVINVQMLGVEPAYRDLRSCFPQEGGRFINDLDMRQRRRVAFLGNDIKEKLFGEASAVGQTVRIMNLPFTVIGVLRPKLQLSSYFTLDKSAVFIPASTFESLIGWRHVSGILYRPKDPATGQKTNATVRTLLAARHGCDPNDSRVWNVYNTQELVDILNDVGFGMRVFMFLIGALTLIVAGVGVANIMFVLVQDSTRQIGIKMAVGAKPRQILRQYLLEGFALVLLGGVIGLLVSWAVLWLIRQIPMDQEGLAYLGRPELSPVTALTVSSVLALIALAAGFFPARRAASVDPVEALRYE